MWFRTATIVSVIIILSVAFQACAKKQQPLNQLNTAGQREGLWKIWVDQYRYEPVEDSSKAEYYALVEFRDGKSFGTATYYFKSGEIRLTTELIDVDHFILADGEHTILYKSGKEECKYTTKNGKFEGKWISWYESGAKMHEAFEKNGNTEGVSTYWYPPLSG